MPELLVLDPDEVAEDRVEVDITSIIGAAGPDWGDAAIEQAMVEQIYGSSSSGSFKVPNRVITIPLAITAADGVSFSEWRRKVQAKVARFQMEGGWIKRQTAEGVLFADVVSASLKLGGGNLAAWGHADTNAQLTIETLPDWYGAEIELDVISETTLPEITAVLEQDGSPAVIKGDYPARCRIAVTDSQGANRSGVAVALRSRHYSSAATAALAYQAEALTPAGSAGIATRSGASGGGSNNTIAHTSLPTSWAPILSTTIASGSADLTHVGTYRVLARVLSPNADVSVRLVWGLGDLGAPVENAGWALPGASAWYLADLGEIRLDRPASGTHRWRGLIQGRGAAGGEDLYIDRLTLVPADDGRTVVTASAPPVVDLSLPSAQDLFTQSAGALNGKTATAGGTWATSGATTDLSVNSSAQNLQRSTTSDSGSGRFAILGSADYSGVIAQVDYETSGVPPLGGGEGYGGVIVRYVDTSNYAVLEFRVLSINAGVGVPVMQAGVSVVVGGAVVLSTYSGITGGPTGRRFRLRGVAYPNGTVQIWAIYDEPFGEFGAPLLTTTHSALGPAGALATGKVGIRDFWSNSTASTRQYDNFAVAAISSNPSAALHSGQTMEIATDGVVRATSDGAAHNAPPAVTGRLPRLPPSGLEDRPVELLVLPSRGDFDQSPDSAIDDITAQVVYRPTYLFVPEA